VFRGTVHNGRDHYFVLLVKVRQGSFRGEVHFIERRVITIEICRVIDCFAIGVVGHQGEVVAEVLFHFKDAAMVDRVCDGAVLVVLEDSVRRICEAEARSGDALCSIPEPDRALREVRRVLKESGRLIFVEHGHSPDPRVAKAQDLLTPFWKRIGGGCHLNREIAELITAAGFQIIELKTNYLPGPRPMTYTYQGLAEPRYS